MHAGGTLFAGWTSATFEGLVGLWVVLFRTGQ